MSMSERLIRSPFLRVFQSSPITFRLEIVYDLFPSANIAAAFAQVKNPGFSFTVSWKQM